MDADTEKYFYGAFWFDGNDLWYWGKQNKPQKGIENAKLYKTSEDAENRLEKIKQNLVDPEKLDIHGVQGIFDFEA